MSNDKAVPTLPEGVLSEEVLEKIGGGDCSISDYLRALQEAQQAYENLIDFTSYVIERVVGTP